MRDVRSRVCVIQLGAALCLPLFLLLLGGGSVYADGDPGEERLQASIEKVARGRAVEPVLALERRLRRELLADEPGVYCELVATLSKKCDRWRGRTPESARLHTMVMNAQQRVRSRIRISKWCELVSCAAAYSEPWRAGDERELPKEWRERRRALATLFLDSIDAVRRGIDPDLDPADRSNWPGPVPLPAGVMRGMDPKHIADPDVRRKYAEAMKEKRRKQAVLHEQGLLRDLDKRQTPYLLSRVVHMYQYEPHDPDELAGLARRRSLTSEERATLLAVVKRQGKDAKQKNKKQGKRKK